MTDAPQDPHDPALNPSLRQRREETYDTAHSTPPPADSASVQREEGIGWPIAWLIVTIVCVAIGIYLVFF
jgi:hypothetical protein